MAQTSLNSTGVASTGALSLQSNGTTEAIGISTGQVATLAQNPILTSGTANGVGYLNGSKVLTTGSALTFDGTNLVTTGYASGVGLRTMSGGGVRFYNSTNGNYSAINAPAGTGDMQFDTGAGEQMRLTSTGLGIGTSSPIYKLVVSNAGAQGFEFDPSTGIMQVYNRSTSAYGEFRPYGSLMRFFTGTSPTETMRLDASGNLGLGVTPSAWSSSVKAMQIGAGGSLMGAGADLYLGNNYYFNGSNNIYLATGTATQYAMSGGQHKWYNAASGTAGFPITFIQAMTLDASGVFLVGRTSPSISGVKVDAEGLFGSIKSGNWSWSFGASAATNAFVINDTTSGSSVERARIDSSGNLLVGTTSQVFGTARAAFDTSGLGVVSRTSAGASQASFAAVNTATTGNNQFVWFYTDGAPTFRGSIEYNRGSGVVAYNTTSDYRAKDILGLIDDSGSVIDSTPVYMGKMKGATQERPMFIAHETPPYAHTGEKDAVDANGNPVFQQMDASSLVPVMWAEIQSLRKRLAAAGI